MNRVFSTALMMGSLFFLGACGDGGTREEKIEDQESTPAEEPKEDTEINDSTAIVMTAGDITLTEVTDFPTYEGASLKITEPAADTVLPEGSQEFTFDIGGETYKLTEPTLDADIKQCANSGKGQHIHLIVNNEPYEAVYATPYGTKREFVPGNYVALAFLSRSYHMSVKDAGAAAVVQFQVGDEEVEKADLEAPHLFYSRPKGSYDLAKDPNLLLDFYLVNTEIAEGGNYVEVTFNGDAANTFKVTKWAPYFIAGLGSGENTMKIELKDKDGNFIEGPFNSVERTFTIQ